MASRYDRARAAPLKQIDNWRATIEPYLPDGGVPILDLGSGTGFWAAAFVSWFDVRVIGVEPSRAMRAEAVKVRSHDRIHYAGGRAEQIPLRDDSCGAAWLSTVVHHFSDTRAAAHALRRVLGPGAPVLVRNAFSGHTEGIPWLRYFDHARHLAERRWPTVDAVVEAFEPAGFALELLATIQEVSARDLAAYAERIRVRVDSTLAAISDEDFDMGMRRLDEAAAADTGTDPVVTELDLLVLR